jgi:ABC-type sulfate transport system permease subunit
MQTFREKFGLAILAGVYLVTSIRFFQGQVMQTLLETVIHILSVAPINLGVTLVLVALLQRLLGERLAWHRTARIFFTVAIMLELVLGLSHYYGLAGVS